MHKTSFLLPWFPSTHPPPALTMLLGDSKLQTAEFMATRGNQRQPEGALLLSSSQETRQINPGKQSSVSREEPDSEGRPWGGDLQSKPLQPLPEKTKVHPAGENASWFDKLCGHQETGCDLRSLSKGTFPGKAEGSEQSYRQAFGFSN